PAAALAAEPAPARKLVVHVVGAVREPGLYRLREGSRVDDAIQRAGGPKPKAALELVNLASPVADGQQVVVPVRGSAGPSVTSSPGAPGTTGGIVHLNSATLEDLDALPGVGPVTAQKILDYRTANGAFSSVDELDAVPGIGPATLEELRPLVGL
ncbi:MAG TPA: helix-hairpin-helix domain-containing protein, partial [Gaiellaceae bacterium]|nr:helix-hairpin-helix domain-containing protein [Gaiellaceae bacterium]